MDIEKNDDTMKEILIEDQKENGTGRKKKSCLTRVLIFSIFLLIIFLGFIFIQQYLLNLEAEAIVRAARTATAMDKAAEEMMDETTETQEQNDPLPTETPTPTPTEDPLIVRTATVSAQLTDVAAFQQTITPEP